MLGTVETLSFTLPAGWPSRLSSGDCSLSDSFIRSLPAMSGCQCRASIRAFTAAVAIDYRRPASLYEVLRIKQNASAMEIKSAYRSLAKVYHPDSAVRRLGLDDRKFIEIHDAYATLSDPSARALYDLSLMASYGRRRPFSYSATYDSFTGSYPTRRWETDQCW